MAAVVRCGQVLTDSDCCHEQQVTPQEGPAGSADGLLDARMHAGQKRQQKQALWAVADWHDSSAGWAGRRSGGDGSQGVQRRC